MDSRYEYRWELRPAGSTTPSASGVVGAGVAQGSQVQLTLDPGLIGTTGNFNVVVGARLSDDPAWVASTTTTTPVRRASVLILGLAMRCGHV